MRELSNAFGINFCFFAKNLSRSLQQINLNSSKLRCLSRLPRVPEVLYIYALGRAVGHSKTSLIIVKKKNLPTYSSLSILHLQVSLSRYISIFLNFRGLNLELLREFYRDTTLLETGNSTLRGYCSYRDAATNLLYTAPGRSDIWMSVEMGCYLS
jgi:hypothetical protein